MKSSRCRNVCSQASVSGEHRCLSVAVSQTFELMQVRKCASLQEEASSWINQHLLPFSLSLESECGCVYPTFTLKISSSDAADTGSFNPLSSSSSTVRSPEMALRISGPMSCNVRRPAYRPRETQTTHLPH